MQSWLQLIHRASTSPTLTLSGVRKIIEDLDWEVPWSEIAEMGLTLHYEDICYTQAKHRQLVRNYWNEDGVRAAFDKLEKRKGKDHSSVSIQMQARTKDSRSQGFCMQNVVISVTPDSCTMTVYYRSTELVQKFLADLIFFMKQFGPEFERLGIKPSVVRFKFANAYLSAMFMPILFRYLPQSEQVPFFERLEKADPKFFRLLGLTTRRFLMETHNYSYKTRVKMWNYWKAHVNPTRALSLKLNELKGDVPVDDDEGDEDGE